MSRSTALQLPDPDHCDVTSRATVWPGGIRTLGPLLVIPGRTVHADDLAAARAHAAAVLAACDQLERP